MADSVGQVTALTTITPIIPERVEALKQILQGVQKDPDASVAKIATIHYARWVIIDNDTRMLFTSNFDGEFEKYLRDFVRDLPHGLDRIWGNCVGYPGTNPFEPFIEYVRQHSFFNNCFYAAYPNLTVQDVLNAQKWREAGRKIVQPMQQFLTETA
jgi:hypothetical protein